VVTLLGWWLFRGTFAGDDEPGARFTSRFFAVCAALEFLFWAGIMAAVVVAVLHGQM
jgi:hypothetical protein